MCSLHLSVIEIAAFTCVQPSYCFYGLYMAPTVTQTFQLLAILPGILRLARSARGLRIIRLIRPWFFSGR